MAHAQEPAPIKPFKPFHYITINHKRDIMRSLLAYTKKAMEHMKEGLMADYPPAERLTEDEIASLWFQYHLTDALLEDVHDIEDGHWECFVENFGLRDAINLLPPAYRERAGLWELLKMIVRECWECRLKVRESDRRKKIKEVPEALRNEYGYDEQ
jgi:hypothetical protein